MSRRAGVLGAILILDRSAPATVDVEVSPECVLKALPTDWTAHTDLEYRNHLVRRRVTDSVELYEVERRIAAGRFLRPRLGALYRSGNVQTTPASE
jgi:hypothetical protein